MLQTRLRRSTARPDGQLKRPRPVLAHVMWSGCLAVLFVTQPWSTTHAKDPSAGMEGKELRKCHKSGGDGEGGGGLAARVCM